MIDIIKLKRKINTLENQVETLENSIKDEELLLMAICI